MTENARIQTFRKLLEKNPKDSRAYFGLAAEYEKLELWDAVVEELQQYLALADDEGNAWGRLGHAFIKSGRKGDAREAYGRGIEEARKHGHPSMAEEFEEIIAGLTD